MQVQAKGGTMTVGTLLEVYEHLLRPDVDAAQSFGELRETAHHSMNQSKIDYAEKETNRAVLRQAVIRELARRNLPANTLISDAMGEEITKRVTPSQDRSVAIANAPAVVDALLRRGQADGSRGNNYGEKSGGGTYS